MKRKIVVGFFGIAMVAFMLFAGSTNAYIPPNTPDATAVAMVAGFSSPNGGTLPYTDTQFDPFNFTLVPWADVTAANLTQFKIVVLVIDTAPQVNLNATQRADLVSWVNNGGKLIIYDSEQSTIDYSWLPYPFTTNNPGQLGATGSITFKEENTLGSTNSGNTAYYLNLSAIAADTDAVGDANVVITQDPNWCGDMLVINYNAANNWTHMYAMYGNGLFIYNGLDIDILSSSTVPGSSSGPTSLARIWLLELLQPWGADYNLPCGSPIVPVSRGPTVGGSIVDVNNIAIGSMGPSIAAYLCIAGFAVLIMLYRKNASRNV